MMGRRWLTPTEAAVLRALDAGTVREAATTLGITFYTARNLLARARTRNQLKTPGLRRAFAEGRLPIENHQGQQH